MQAAITEKLGSLKYLKHGQIPTPKPKRGETLIKIEYCGVNHLDLLIIQGKRTGPKSFPHILGSEFVGKIVQTNERVAVYPWTFCGECKECRKGNENICDNGGTFGRTRWGGFAEYATVPVKNLVKIPKGLSSKEVSACLLSSITAYHILKRAEIKNNSTVLITGATGGVGTSTIQMLKRKKCKLVCTTSHAEKADKLRSFGVDKVIDIHNLDRVREVDCVIDMMGGEVWSKALETLRKNGTMVFCSTTLDDPASINLASAFFRQVNILGSYGGTMKDLKEVIKLLQKGIIKPVIDSIWPLGKTQEALTKLSQQKAFGKILINVSS